MLIDPQLCWICGCPANSGEHKIKKSDIKKLMGNVNQQNPIYHRANGIKMRPIGSFNAEALKYSNSICTRCNNSLTQKHDRSWGKLSDYLKSHFNSRLAEVQLSAVFGQRYEEDIRNIQLFFAKQFGCNIQEALYPFDLGDIAQAIRDNKIIPNLYLKLRHSDNGYSKNYCAVSDLQVSKSPKQQINYIHFFYTFGAYSMDVMYSECPDYLDISEYFLPSDISNSICICKVDYLQ